MLPEPYLTDFREHLEVFEGRVPWMYLDTQGNVTVAIGHMISSASAAMKLPFSGARAFNEWYAVKDAKAGLAASAYQHITMGRLTDESINMICTSDVAEAFADLSERMQFFSDLPASVQQAMLDMAFNLGTGRLWAEYFGAACHFGPAIQCGDWKTAALESARRGIADGRNQYVADLILSA